MLQRLAIVGVGLIGGSVGMAARSAGRPWHVIGVGTSAASLAKAVAVGAVDEVADTISAAVAGADLVVLATPIDVTSAILPAVAAHVRPGATVTDVGSTKRSIVAAAAAVWSGASPFVGSHPMAGGERGGVDYARADLLRDAVCVVTPTGESDPSHVKFAEEFWHQLGMRTTRLSPDEHDRLVASVSHGPHAVAAAVARATDPAALPLAAGGYRDVTRIAGGDPALWQGILLDNRTHLLAAVGRVRTELDELSARLKAGDAEGIRRWLAEAAGRRSPARIV